MKNQPLQRQFRLWTVLLVIVPSLLIMVIYTVGQMHVAKQKNLELISQRVEFQQQLIEYWLTERANDVRKLSQLEAFRSLDEGQMKSTLELMQRYSKDFDSLSYIDQDGYFRMSTLAGGIRHTSTTGQPYFEAAALGKEYISDVVIGRNSGLPIINFSAPIYDTAGNFQGLILGSVRTTTIETLLRDNWMGQTGEILLVNHEGRMLAEPRYVNRLIDKGSIEGTSKMKVKLSADALRNIHLGETGSAGWIDYLGNKVLGAYRYMPERGWTLIGSIGEDEILAPIYTQLGMMTGGTFLLVLFILPLATRLTHQIKRPIDWLIRQSNLVAAENYEMVGQDNGLTNMPYELSKLCETFVHMSRKIEITVSLLKENEAELESKVRESTSQLREINATLEEKIRERQAAQDALSQKTEEIRKMAYTDALTGLPNRAYLNKRLEEEMELGRQGEATGAILFIDLDDLKMINDTFGHKCGDTIIIMSGNRIVEAAGDGAFTGRIGGDEFIVVLPGARDRKWIAEIADKILEALSHDVEMLGIRFPISASMGIAVYPDDGDTAEEICKNADNAMYEAKKAGKRCWRFYEEAMQAEVYERIMLTNRLRYAAEKGELLLHYQPQVNAYDAAIVGFEALLRWNSPEHGCISPVRFIPLAEQSGLIKNIGKWVLREACQFARRLSDLGKGHIHVAVNVSPYQLCADDFVNIVREALHDAGIEPRQLELEITENALMGSLEEGTRKLEELRTMGVRLSLDDFGTGYSSLTYLQRLPVNTLKVDKAFIDMILMEGTQKAIIRTIVDMAHSMEMTVVAEGVETRQQLDYLTRCRCDCFQGYIISRPVPEEEAVRFLSDRMEPAICEKEPQKRNQEFTTNWIC
jgi:diguanylate cyclase (GGDEF)-like protein